MSKDNKLRRMRIICWLIFGVFSSLFAIALSILFYYILGYNWEQIKIECAPDFFLLVFAVASNAMNLVVNFEKNINAESRLCCGIISGITLLIYISLYSFGFKFFNNDNSELFSSVFIDYLLIASGVFLFLNIIVGIRIEGTKD